MWFIKTVVVWLKIRKNDIEITFLEIVCVVVVWLKIRKNDINKFQLLHIILVVVWLKIRKNDIKESHFYPDQALWFD